MTNGPNIVYILADDMGYGDLSCLNASSKIRTEHLDRMAAAGMVFEDAHATSAVCTPSRYSILTGRYNWRSRLKSGVLGGYSTHLIEPGRMTVASFLKDHDYHTAMIGKWHQGWDWTTTDGQPALPDGENVDFSAPVTNGPDAYGFDYYYGHCGALDMAPYVYVENGRTSLLKLPFERQPFIIQSMVHSPFARADGSLKCVRDRGGGVIRDRERTALGCRRFSSTT